MLVFVRWYAAYSLSLRNLQEMMAERGVAVDHATVHRWALKILPLLAKVFRSRKRPVGRTWRVDETYIKVGGQWKYLYAPSTGSATRGLPAHGQAGRRHGAAFLRARDRSARRAREGHHRQERATTAAVHSFVADSGVAIELRQSKYLNNLVEQDHRAIKRRTRPMLGFKDFHCAGKIIAGIETMHMIRKDQSDGPEGQVMSAAELFYSLAI